MSPKDSHRDGRPDPDALLAICETRRGKLKVFLGAAPGVGKTFAMLSQARALRQQGVDVVIGVAETHGRSETAALTDGLEVLPRKPIEYRGHVIQEFDIDAALARKPKLVVIDELAHTNAPDSRHPQRYQDVEEVLAAGIDVWTALNIQHLESLSDVVCKITGVVVRETVPDTVLETANEVVVVDITPTELLQRLRDGKVYLPDNAKRAADHFFKPGNLTALRELALRRTADRVDDQMVDYLRQNAIEGPWPTAERILVCVGGDAQSQAVVRAAGRLANGLNATWVAVHLEREGHELTDETSLQRVDETMRLAERLGAETARLSAKDLPEALLRYARRENTTQIVLGRSKGGRWARLRKRSLCDAIVEGAVDIAVHVITAERTREPSKLWRRPRPNVGLAGSLVAAGSVAAAVLVGQSATHWLKLPNLSMIFLAAVLLSAVTHGVWAAIVASILSFVAYNFFFIQPVYTLTIAAPHELFALVIFLMVAVFTGGLAGRVREQSDAVRRRISVTQSLYDFSRKLSGTAKLDEVLWVIASHAAAAVKGQAIILLAENDELSIRAAFPPEDSLGPSEWAAARWAFERGETAGRHSTTLPNALYQFRPIRTTRGVEGAIGLQAGQKDRPLSAEEERAVEALFDQAAVAIERTLLVDEAASAQAAADREKLRGALLSSISHDLRTPLASIVGSVTSLRQFGEQMPREARDDLLAAIEEEAARLSRFVSNLLDITTVESGALDVRRDWVDVGDAVRAAVARARKSFSTRQIDVAIGRHTILVRGDASLLEQVVFNLLDNADKYSSQGTPTAVSVLERGRDVLITVADQGPGVAADEIDRIFEKFYRGKHGDGRAPGTGLGLAICRGIAEAMGGDIRAESPIARGRGTRLVVRLPADTPALVPAALLETHAGARTT